MSNAAMNLCAQFLCRHASSSFGQVPSRGTAGSEGNCVQFLKNCQSIFTRWLPNFTAESVKVPVSPHRHQRLLLSIFGTLAILWHLTVVSICFSLMTEDTKYFFMCSLAIYVFSLEKRLFKSFAYF